MGEFPFGFLFNRSGVAMNALEVAGLGDIPHHHGALVFRKLKEMRGEILGSPSVSKGIRGFHRTTIEFGYTDHYISSTG
jgi:hypothetical protein